VIHRDIKPHNILITETGDVKVTDFGIARAASSSTMTRTGSILGTAHYISPEQAMGEPVGPSSDLYSLGVVLYEMLTGELPYDADTPLGIAMKHVNGRLRPPKEIDPSIPAGINAITCRLLAKDPEDRYASDAELIEDLERVVAGLEPANATTEMMTRLVPATAPTRVGPPPPYGGRRSGKRRRWLPLVLALLALLLLVPLALAGYNFLQDRQQEEQVPQIAVPDLVGMTLNEAEDQVGDDFDIVEAGSEESEEPVNTILSQDPRGGGKAEKGSEISVTVVGTQVADVPNVVRQNSGGAQQTLEDAGFEVTVQERESSFEEEGLVVGQDPQGGKSAEVGSVVTITVGTGPQAVEVPSLYGSTPDQAATILAEVDLELGEQTEAPSDEVSDGQIFEQQPAAGADVEPGSEVSVTVSSGPESSTVPDVVGLPAEQAQAELWNAYFASELVTVRSDEPEGTVVSTDPPAGTQADWEAVTVTVNVSAGPPPEPTRTPPDRQPNSGPGGGNPGNGGGDNQRDNRGNNEDRGRGND
jgi:serine/threonine-protein kinase